MRKLESEMHHEFQLERAILFSDAVFAIAITLMVIELKIPEVEKNESSAAFWSSVSPVIRNFIAFLVSFFFIGMYWYRHLKLCGLLTDYNRSLVTLNLVFLFFIVLFPFSVSSMMQLSKAHIMFGAYLYFANVFFTTVTHFILYNYLLGKGKKICKPVSDSEKKILLEQSFMPIILLVILFLALLLSTVVQKSYPDYATLVYVPAGVIAFLLRRYFRRRHKKLREAFVSGLA